MTDVTPQALLDASDDACQVRRRVERLRDRLDRGPGAREASNAITRLQEAELWLQHASTIVAQGGEGR